MKPLPSNIKELEKEIKSLKIKPGEWGEQESRKKMIQYALESKKINRSFNHCSILVVGTSGVGKSSTINNLFGLEEGETKFAKTSDCESMTKETTEFILEADSQPHETEGLTLGIVDTAGFNDTTGQKQDACTMYSVGKFFETHPKMKNCYPNLILVLVAASDPRIAGENSNLSKSLMCLGRLNLVDKDHPNVVGVLTKATDLKPKKQWSQLLKQKQGIIEKAIFNYLNVQAEIIPIENMDIEEMKNDPSDEWSVLPDKTTLQPLNLFTACVDRLNKNDDKLGAQICSSVFELDKASKKEVQLGHNMTTKDSTSENLDHKEEELFKYIQKIAEGGPDDPLFTEAENFKEQNTKTGEEREEIDHIFQQLKMHGVEDVGDVELFTLDGIKEICEISEKGEEFLGKLKIGKTPVEIGDVGLMGRGYNLLLDRTVAGQAMVLRSTNIRGLTIPEGALKEMINDEVMISDSFEDNHTAIASRMNKLSVGIEVDNMLFKIGARAGVNNHSSTQMKSGSREYSFLMEKREFQLNFANFGNEEITFSESFKKAVEDLPDEYTKTDSTNRTKYERFFNSWGHMVVTQAFGGGSVELKIDTKFLKTQDNSFNEVTASLEVGFGLKNMIGVSAGVGGSSGSGGDFGNSQLLKHCKVNWNGGSKEFQNLETLSDASKLRKWKLSTMKEPVMLDTELSLQPITILIHQVNSSKDDNAYTALVDLLGGEFTLQKSREKLAETKAQEMVKSRKEASARAKAKTRQAPKSNSPCTIL